jgi:nucleotidyltransferase/DNA polymerase involved in DNA repair
MDSVREGKLLSHGKYLLIEERDQQQMGIQGMFQKHTDVSRQKPPKTSSTPSSPQKSSVINNNPYAKKYKSLQSPNERNENLSSLYEEPQTSPVNHGHSTNLGILTSPNKTDKKFIYGKLRTVGTDPNFLDSYFASSRLSFIGSFKQRTPSTHYSNVTVPSPLFSNSKKLVFHVDMDCFFASVVLRNFPHYQDKPVVISHHGNHNNKDHNNVPKNSSSECATCNYEARKYGIKKGMYLGKAKELCPELIVLMYDFEGYEEVSQQVLEILDRLATSEDYRGVVETVSCDEAYVELNFNASEESDKLFDHAYQIAESIRNDIFDTTRCTASIGVGLNKFLAKLGTDKAKPNKSYCVRDYRELLKSLKLREMHGVGWRTEMKLVEESLVTVQDVWDLGSRGESELIRILGPGTGKKIFRFTQGKDDRPITPVERKTIGAECNYGVRFDGPYGIDHFMEGLAQEVEKRMKGISMKGKKLTLKIKQRKKGASNKHKFLGHGSCHNLSKSIGIPGNTATRDAKLFAKIGLSLFREFAIVDIHEIRGMGITISNLENDGDTGKQTNISGMQYWLHQSNELGIVKNSGTTEEALRSKEFITEETTDTNCRLLSTPNPGEKLEVEIRDVVRNEESPLVIELPPISQIQMSQVDALPSELRQQVRSRMKTASAGCIGEENIDGDVEDKSIEIANTFKRFVGEGYPNANDMLLSTPESIGQIGNGVQKDTTYREVLQNVESSLLIELPPMSQIRMTQVEALPPELQQQIHSRMNGITTGVIEEEIVDTTADEQPINCVVAKEQVVENEGQHFVNRFRQTDLKRMMKLAAVRSGHESTSISLTQLEQLPLEIKLQVVNHDDRQIGVLSQHVHRPASFNDRLPRKFTSNTVNDMGDTISKPKRTVLNHAKNSKARKTTSDANSMMDPTTAVKNKSLPQIPRRELQIIERVDVWKEDLLPLKEFLNDNCPLRYPNSIGMVLDFLSIVLKEGRLPAMVTMIRCIRNRKDGWSKIEIIERIARAMNDLHIERYGATLDVAWLMGIEE